MPTRKKKDSPASECPMESDGTDLEDFIPCKLMELPEELQDAGVATAVEINPGNMPRMEMMAALLSPEVKRPQALAWITTKLWSSGEVDLPVGFMDNPSQEWRRKVLFYANQWGKDRRAAINFREASLSMARIRVAGRRGQGHYSYLGTDCLHVRSSEPTMNLELSLSTRDEEWMRVVPHEFGHALGAPHEHLRKAIVDRLDRAKVLAYFRRYQGWPDNVTIANVLTPLEEVSLLATPEADETSVMAYSLPGFVTKDNRPILGGPRINDRDYAWAAKTWPGTQPPPPPPPPPPPGGAVEFTLSGRLEPGTWTLTRKT